MASTVDNHGGPTAGTAIKCRAFPEIAEAVKGGYSNYNDILELFNVGTSIPDEVEDFEVTKLLFEVLDSKIPLPANFIDELKLNVCDWLGVCMPSLFSTKKWKRALALKLIGTLLKVIGNIELSSQVRWEVLRNTLLRQIDSLLDLVCERDKHWFDVWIVAIDVLGNKLALNSNRPLLNKLFKVISPFKEDFQKFPPLQEAVREVPFKLLTVACWQKVVDYWLQGAANVPLNHVMIIIRFFKRLDVDPVVFRAKCLCMWRVVCLLPPGHKGLQPSIDQLLAMMLNQNSSKVVSKGAASPGASNLELVPDVLSEMLALMLGANLCPDHELVVSSELLLPTHDLVGASSMFLQKIFQCFEKLLLINPVKNAIKPNGFAIKTGFSCFLSKLNSNPSYELINSVLKLPQNIFAQANDNVAVLNNCIDVVVRGIVCGPYCFGDNIMSSSKYYSGSNDLMTGSPTLMLTRYLLDKTKLELLDIDIVLSILEKLIPKGTKTVHYILRVMFALKSLGTDKSIAFVTVLKVWQILVVSINTQYCCEADFTRETPDLGWIYSVILFPLNSFNDQHGVEIANYIGSKHQSELISKLLTNKTNVGNVNVTCEALAVKLDRLLSTANDSCLPPIAAATRALVTSTPFTKFPRGQRCLKSTFSLVTNLVNLKCPTEGFALDLIKIVEALSVCLDGHLPTLVKLTSLVVSLLLLPSQNKCVTDSALITSLVFIDMAEKEYGNNAVPYVTKLKAAYQYCQRVAKADETRSLIPKCPTASSVLPPAMTRHVTPKRVGPSPRTNTVEAAPAEQKLPKILQADPGPSQPTNESSPKLEPPKKSTASRRPSGPLTKHQREKMRERQDNIPALYVDLTQESQAVADSQPEFTQDSSSLVMPQRFIATSATLGADSNVASRPFASVVQEPRVVLDNGAKVDEKERGKAIYEIFRKNKPVVLQPIHLRKVCQAKLPSEAQPLIEAIKPDETASQDRPFKAFSPANKNKCEPSESANLPLAITRRCLLPEADFSQDVVADTQRAETPPALIDDDGIAMFPTDVNSPVREPDQGKKDTAEGTSPGFSLKETYKRKSLKRSMSNSFEDSEPSRPLRKKQGVAALGNEVARKSTVNTGLVDESSNNSTDSNISSTRKSKRTTVTRRYSNSFVNESPLPAKQARKVPTEPTSKVESNSNAKAEKPRNGNNSSKSQVLNNSDCHSVASEASSSASDVSRTKTYTRRSQFVSAEKKEDILGEMSSSLEEPEPLLKPISKPKTRSSIGKSRGVVPVLPESVEQNQKEVALECAVVNVANRKPVSIKANKKYLKKKAVENQDFTQNLDPAAIKQVTHKEDSQNILAEEPILQLSTSVASSTLKFNDNSSVVTNCIVPLVPVIEKLAPEIDLTKDALSSSANEKHESSSNDTLPSRSSSSTTPLVNEDEEKDATPLACVIPDGGSSDSGICKDLLPTKNTTRLESDARPGNQSLHLVSNKENKIVEESQDSIIPSSQTDSDTFKSLITKRKHIRPKILSRSSVKSASKMNVLSSVSVVPETQILDIESATETPGVTSNPNSEQVTEVVLCKQTDGLEQQSENGELALVEDQMELGRETAVASFPSNTDVQIVLTDLKELNSHSSYTPEQVVEATEDLRQKDNEVTTDLPSKDATVAANGPENEPDEDMKSPPRPGPKVMENLSPSMLRLLNRNLARKAPTPQSTCRSKKMLQMVLPFVPETNVRLKPQAEKQETCIYVDQTFPAQECLVGEDGTPVLRDWKKCTPSPSSVPARSSMKGSLQKNESGKKRKLCFPFEPTTKVLFYYEKKNSKCNDSISQIKIKKLLRKKRKALKQQKTESEMGEDQSMEVDVGVKESSTSCDPAPVVPPCNEPSLTKPNSSIADESPSFVKDSHLPARELISPPEFQTSSEESASISPPAISLSPDKVPCHETLQSTPPMEQTLSVADESKPKECVPVIADNIEPITYPGDTPMFSSSCEMVTPKKLSVILPGTQTTEEASSSIPVPATKPTAVPNTQAASAGKFEDSYHDYVAPTPLSLPDPELLNGTDPLYENLVNCQQPITFMIPSLTTPQWEDNLRKVLAERNILTVGDFCQRTERQIDLLPIKDNKVKTALRALDKYKLRLQIADACAKDLLKGVECNKHSKEVFDHLYPVIKISVDTSETQTCSGLEDKMHDNFVRNATSERLISAMQESGKFADDNFVANLVKEIEPRKYVSMHCSSGSVDDLSLELANSINLLPDEMRKRHIFTLLSHLKFKG